MTTTQETKSNETAVGRLVDWVNQVIKLIAFLGLPQMTGRRIDAVADVIATLISAGPAAIKKQDGSGGISLGNLVKGTEQVGDGLTEKATLLALETLDRVGLTSRGTGRGGSILVRIHFRDLATFISEGQAIIEAGLESASAARILLSCGSWRKAEELLIQAGTKCWEADVEGARVLPSLAKKASK